MRLTKGMLGVLMDVLNEAEAGGYIVHTQGMEDKEAKKWCIDAGKASKWLAAQIVKRDEKSRKSKTKAS